MLNVSMSDFSKRNPVSSNSGALGGVTNLRLNLNAFCADRTSEVIPMARGKDQFVIWRGDCWAVKGAGNSRDTSHHARQSDAIVVAREIAKNQKSELVVLNKAGKIRQKDSFGHDPPGRG